MNKLYRLYLALAAFVVMTTVFGLIVQRSVMSASDASAASSRFVSHKAAYDQLRLLGIRVQSAANEVFGNGEVEKQSTQVELAFAEFDRSMNREWADIILTEAGADAKLHLAALSDAETAMADVVREARLSFEALRHGHGNEAVARMARMNHAYDRIRKKMSDVDAVITSL